MKIILKFKQKNKKNKNRAFKGIQINKIKTLNLFSFNMRNKIWFFFKLNNNLVKTKKNLKIRNFDSIISNKLLWHRIIDL